MSKRSSHGLWAAGIVFGLLTSAVASDAADYRGRLPEDEVIYFVLPDRFENGDTSNDMGGIKGDRYSNGFDPSAKGFYQGGDLKGLTRRLDYIEGLGVTAIWLGPIYRNKPVQGGPGQESAGYHGYWITDFTRVDPHFGTRVDMKAFVDAAHARGMKIYLDIITNHTADVIQYKECPASACVYRSRAEYPYSTLGGTDGAAINTGFAGDTVPTVDNFARLTNPNYAYTPVIPKAERDIKAPAWLNDPIYYHNRGNSTFRGESSRHGDFSGLDDLMTENPRVVQGFIDIYGAWIDEFKVDGFRIDTAKHVNPEFWQVFVPAMLDRARANGIPNFHIFGEVADDDFEPGKLAVHTRRDRLPAVLDFAFKQAALRTIAGDQGTEAFARLYDGDVLYEGGEDTAMQLPTFLGNHDQGRFAHYVEAARPGISDDEVLRRVILGNAIMMFTRGVPTIYSGDEQGFVGDGGDQDAREPLFPSKTASYNDNDLVGTDATTADANFDTRHPIYLALAAMAKLRSENPELRRGRQIVRATRETPGLLAVSRIGENGRELLVAFNTSNAPIAEDVEVGARRGAWHSLAGPCSSRSAAPGSLEIELPAFGYAVCVADTAEMPK